MSLVMPNAQGSLHLPLNLLLPHNCHVESSGGSLADLGRKTSLNHIFPKKLPVDD